jgi:hypothetical protein
MTKISFKILFCFTVLILSRAITAQEKIQANFDYSEGKIFIYYEFKGDYAKEYEIGIVLKRTSDSRFNLVPEDLSGDIGTGNFANKKCRIVWTLLPDEEAMLDGEDFYFDVTAKEIVEGGGVPWYVFVGGAALVGGTAAVLVLGKKSSSDSSTPPVSSFPTPPNRP